MPESLVLLADAAGVTITTLIMLAVAAFFALVNGALLLLVKHFLVKVDRSFEKRDRAIDDLYGQVASEREDRHLAVQTVERQVAGVKVSLERHPTRDEGMKQFGTVLRGLNGLRQQIEEQFDRLPCRAPARPGGSACPTGEDHHAA